MIPRVIGAVRAIDFEALKWFLGRIKPFRGGLFGVALLSVLQSALTIPTLALLRRALDVVLPAKDFVTLWWIGAAILGLRVFGSALAIWIRFTVLSIVKRVVQELRDALAVHLLERDRVFYTRADTTQLHTRVVQDTERVDTIATAMISGVLPAFLTAMILVVVMARISTTLVLLGALALPVLWGIGRFTSRHVKQELNTFRARFEESSAGAQFLLRFTDLIRQRSWQREAGRSQHERHDTLRAAGVSMGMSYAWHVHAQRMITGVVGIAMLLLGGAAVARGDLTLGEFFVFYIAAGMLNGSLDTLLGSVPELIAGSTALRALRDIMSEGEPEPYRGDRVVQFSGGIQLERVSFSFGERALLRDVSMRLESGSRVAILGENGAGKSTLANLLLGVYRPALGTVRADGVPYTELDQRTFRRQFGVVPQHPLFFQGTVRENLCYGHAEIGEPAIENALRLSAADCVVAKLPYGLDTIIGDRGTRLSGGEAQRLSIARALLHRPSMLILDEPTTHLDAESVAHLLGALDSWSHTLTIVMISHDPAIRAFARQVFQLEDGRLSEL